MIANPLRLLIARTFAVGRWSSIRAQRPFATSDPDLDVREREMTLSLPSRRLDAILRRTSHISTSSLEKLLHSGGVRVNEQVEKKKAHYVDSGDQIEMFLEAVPENADLARVHRVEVVDYELGKTNYQILCTVFTSLVVPNWRSE